MKSQLPSLTSKCELVPQAAVFLFEVNYFLLLLMIFFHLFTEVIFKTKCSIPQNEKESCWSTLNEVPSMNIYLSAYLFQVLVLLVSV